MTMKVGLLTIGGDTWIAGIYYISNLVRALRSLPENEQPEIVLVSAPGVKNNHHYEDIEGLVEPLSYTNPRSIISFAPEIRRTVKRMLSRSLFALLLARGAKRLLEGNPNRVLAQTLRDKDVSLLFPCANSMGPDFCIPWLAWAWDFQHKYYPEFFSKEELQSRDQIFAKLATDARLIVASSHDALDHFDRFFPGYHQKLRVLHFRTVPAPAWYEADVIQTCRKFNLPPRYLMLPNQFWVHKNHRVAFETIKILVDRGVDVHLVCTGNTTDYQRPGYFQHLCDYIRRHNLENRIRILGLIPRHEQIQVVRGAMAILQPSLFEGWSTVVEDARALGKRLFLSDIPVHREQCPPGAMYFDPHSSELLAEEIAKEWNALSPGPCLVDEQAALATQHKMVAEYARDFLLIAQELLEASNYALPNPE